MPRWNIWWLAAAVAEAARLLRAGELVAFPTETVYGLAARAILRQCAGNDPARLRSLDLRFAAPVFPGETLRTEIWRESPGVASYRASVVERDLVVLNNGYVEYA